MIFDVVIIFAVGIINLLGRLLSLINLSIPAEFQEAIAYFISYVNYLRGVLPIDTILTAIGFYSLFLGVWYSYKVLYWVFGHLPWFGKHAKHPKVGPSRESK